MGYMKLKYNVRFDSSTEIGGGTILLVEDEPSISGLVFILEGEFKDRTIHASHLEDIDLGQLVEDLRIAQKDELRAVAAADRLTDENIKLQTEIKRLMDEVDEARESKKVVLPKEAVDEFSKLGYDIHAIMESIHLGRVSTKYLRTIVPYPKVLAALVNGYTIEKTKEERLREGVAQIMHLWCTDQFSKPEDAVNRVTDFVTKFNAEN